jgi:hypothetical protein
VQADIANQGVSVNVGDGELMPLTQAEELDLGHLGKELLGVCIGHGRPTLVAGKVGVTSIRLEGSQVSDPKSPDPGNAVNQRQRIVARRHA